MTNDETDRLLSQEAPEGERGVALPLQADEPPPPPLRATRRRKLPIATLVLGLAAAGGLGFFAGVRVEKAQVTPTASGSGTPASSLAAAFANAANRGAGGAPPSGTPGAGANPSANSTAGPAATGGAANIIGTVTVVQGGTLYVTETNGDTVKVTTSDGTTVTKTVTGAVKDLTPGESVVVRGVESADGVYAAQSVTQATAGNFAGGFGRGGAGRGGGTRSGSGTGTGTGTGSGNPSASPRS